MAKARARTGPTLVQRSRRLSPMEKATYHQVSGAGRSQVRRPFLGLTDAEIATITTRLDTGIRKRTAS